MCFKVIAKHICDGELGLEALKKATLIKYPVYPQRMYWSNEDRVE